MSYRPRIMIACLGLVLLGVNADASEPPPNEDLGRPAALKPLYVVPDSTSDTTPFGLPWQAYLGSDPISPVQFYTTAGKQARADSIKAYLDQMMTNHSWKRRQRRLYDGFGTAAELGLANMGAVGVGITAAFWIPSQLIFFTSWIFLRDPDPVDAIRLETATAIATTYNRTLLDLSNSEPND